jgi:hypothetical protein
MMEGAIWLKPVQRKAAPQDFLDEVMCAFSRLTDEGLEELVSECPAQIEGRPVILRLSLKRDRKRERACS